jgi:hypothetical protein
VLALTVPDASSGAVVSTATTSAALAALTLLAASVTVAVTLWLPLANVLLVMSTKPAVMLAALRTALPTWVAPSNTLTVSPASGAATPTPFSATRIVGVTTLVLSSTLLVPLSLADSKSTPGAAGAVTSLTVMLIVSESVRVPPVPVAPRSLVNTVTLAAPLYKAVGL